MKLPKEYFVDHRNLKHYPQTTFLVTLEKECKKAFGISPKAGNVFAVESEFDGKLYMKLSVKVTDWEKTSPNVWVSSFTGMLKIYDVRTNTTMIIYRK